MENGKDLMTIKAFAEASGRSPQTIYKQIGTRLAPYVQEIEGQKFIERKALAEVFGVGVQPRENNSDNSKDNPIERLYSMLQAELEAKNRLIEELTQQIKQLQAELAKEREHSREKADQLALLAAQAQSLHAGTIKMGLLPGEAAPEAPESPVEASQGEPGQMDAQKPSEGGEGLRRAVKGLSWGEILRMKFKKGE